MVAMQRLAPHSRRDRCDSSMRQPRYRVRLIPFIHRPRRPPPFTTVYQALSNGDLKMLPGADLDMLSSADIGD